ncbi:MAG: UDP-glucose/GDP-mannose dehydrogenase family protein [Gemmatimonadetes bacterium]|nr:UDP-glucose/GDP-mannose dehydrogenase family protein [Gemmatimonadota bacterium]
MNVAVIGTGYVGLVVGACLAEAGNNVICADVDEAKIKDLKSDRIPIHERGLTPLVVQNQAAGRLEFTSDVGAAVERSDIVFIAVGTPPDEDGSADLQHVVAVAEMIGEHMNSPKIIITKSTVPVGTADKVRETIASRTSTEFHMCSNPEFLKEGAAVDDFMKPDRVVVGVDSEKAADVLAELYAPFVRTGNPLIFTDIQSAEITKYAANAMLATRISFMNQIAELCEHVGADVNMVRKGIGSDPRIGSAFLFPGPGYGGSCFPKDVRALMRTGEDVGVPLDILRAVDAVNERQKTRLVQKTQAALGVDFADATVAVWGLAFKAETDDMRESPAIDLVEGLIKGVAKVCVYDPAAMPNAKRIFGNRVEYGRNEYDVLRDADALVVVTEWLAFRNPDFARMKRLLRRPIIIDGRNLYKPDKLQQMGFSYSAFGRPGCVS